MVSTTAVIPRVPDRSEERIASNILADRLTSPSSRRCFGRNSDDRAGVVLTADTNSALVSSSDTMTRHPVPDLLPGTLDLLILRTLQTELAARLGDLGAHPADLPGRPADQPGLALPGAPSPRAPGLDRSRVGRLGAGPAGQVLPAHAIRAPAAGGRSRRVGAHVHGHRPRDEAGVTA